VEANRRAGGGEPGWAALRAGLAAAVADALAIIGANIAAPLSNYVNAANNTSRTARRPGDKADALTPRWRSARAQYKNKQKA
jgi:hypothetical protein